MLVTIKEVIILIIIKSTVVLEPKHSTWPISHLLQCELWTYNNSINGARYRQIRWQPKQT